MEGRGGCPVMEINLKDLWQEGIVFVQREDEEEPGHWWWGSSSNKPHYSFLFVRRNPPTHSPLRCSS